MKRFTLALITGVFLSLFASLGKAQTGTLTIEVKNFKTDTGVVIVHLFREQDDVPRKPFRKATAMIINSKATVVFPNTSFGDYATILFHDKNANGKLDHKLGLPNEPMGFSNQWKLSLFSGMPSFNKLRFAFANDIIYEIKLR